MVIALDAFGSDGAPTPELDGAISFARLTGSLPAQPEVILVGDKARLTFELERRNVNLDELPLSLVHAPEVIEMDDTPSVALRRKRDSSMHRAMDLVREGRADAVVTAGNSGAAMAVGVTTLGRLPGVERPAFAGVFPRKGGATVVLDLGANVECKPQHLAEFAVMGGIYAHATLEIPAPRVGLLSNGTEESKGTEATRAAYAILSKSFPAPLDFVGYVEGDDLWNGKIDVAVVDGFTGNIVLKTVESLALNMFGGLRDELRRSRLAIFAWLIARNSVRRVLKKTDFAEVGGAPLLGVNGVAIVAHGRSNAIAIKNALGLAQRTVAAGANERLAEALADTSAEESPA